MNKKVISSYPKTDRWQIFVLNCRHEFSFTGDRMADSFTLLQTILLFHRGEEYR